jgi:hypothetical protein
MVRRRQGLIRRLLGAGLAIILIASAPASTPAAQARLGGQWVIAIAAAAP